MKLVPIVKSDLLINNVGSDEQRTYLIKEAFLRKQNTPSINNTNDGCWRGIFKYSDIDWLIQEVESSAKYLVSYYLEKDPSYKIRLKQKTNSIDYWTNINDPGSLNRLHSHKDVDYVGLYFLQSGGTGDLIFHNPANLLTDCSDNSPFISRMIYKPKDGDLLIWPGWVPHEVEVNNSNKHRINIAFNIKL